MLTAHTLNDRICAHSHDAAHAMEVPPNARLLFCNGQVGARKDGTVPDDPDLACTAIYGTHESGPPGTIELVEFTPGG